MTTALRTRETLLSEHLTEQVQSIWAGLTPTERQRILRQRTIEGLRMALADHRRKSA